MTQAPFISDSDFTLYVGDVREVLAELPDGSVDCVVTSPPYWGLRDYGTGLWEGGDDGCDHAVPRGSSPLNKGFNERWGNASGDRKQEEARAQLYRDVCGKCGATRKDQQLGLEPTPDLYVEAMVGVFREVRRVLAPHGTCWLNLGDSYNAYNGNRGLSGSTLEGTDRPEARPRLPSGHGLSAGGLKPKDMVGVPWRVAQALQAPYYAGRIRDEKERIWLAAVVEAEGCMFIHRRKAGTDSGAKFTKKDGTEVSYARTQDTYGAGLEVSSTDRVIVERCMAITGIGSICEQTPEANKRRKQTIYRWNVRSNECRWIIRELYPHFYAKQHEARLLLGCPSSGDDARKSWASLKALHQGQSADIDFRAPEGMWEEGWFLRSDVIWAKLDPTRCPRA